jgi:tetratricopeptide (TPR) repeat protein
MPDNKQQHQQSPPQKVASMPASTPAAVKVKKDSPGLHVRHESALYMKANLEYLGGNTTKSLKLCAEARTAGRKSRAEAKEENGLIQNDTATAAAANGSNIEAVMEEDVETQMANDYDEAIYYNNLAMVHQSAGKIHVALHYYSYAISYMENVKLPNDNYFWSDGVARPNVTTDILNNVSLCAFQAHDYKRAYECMARCVTLSPSILGERGRCWLRMAQSLIGRFCSDCR